MAFAVDPLFSPFTRRLPFLREAALFCCAVKKQCSEQYQSSLILFFLIVPVQRQRFLLFYILVLSYFHRKYGFVSCYHTIKLSMIAWQNHAIYWYVCARRELLHTCTAQLFPNCDETSLKATNKNPRRITGGEGELEQSKPSDATEVLCRSVHTIIVT